MEQEGYRAREYSTFEKAELLIEMAKDDPDVANTLMRGSREDKLKVFRGAGLSQGEVEAALEHMAQTFGKSFAGEAILW